MEPTTKYISGWHLDAISEHLEALTHGKIRNLLINEPPRHCKSLSVSVFWPTWTWTHSPEVKWFCTSYADNLAMRDAVKSRRILMDKWYQERWGRDWQMSGDQNQKHRYENTAGGYRISMGVGGGATGEGGDIIIVDDPMKAKDQDSKAVLEFVIHWWDEVMSSRVNDPKTARKVIIMQRLNERDLAGHVLSRMMEGGEHYEHLCLPAEYEGNKYTTSIGWKDPRKEPGDLLWPERFGRKELETLKAALGPRGAAGQLQQRPSPAGGAIYKREWWEGQNRYDLTDEKLRETIVGSWLSLDTGMKANATNDYSVCTIWDMYPSYQIAPSHMWRAKVEFPVLLEEAEKLAREIHRRGHFQGILIEDKVSGTSMVQTLRAAAPEWLQDRIVAFQPRGDKQYRARQAAIWSQRGCVLLPHPCAEAPWLFTFEEEIFNFPGSAYDDITDTVSQVIIYLEHYLAAYWQRVLEGSVDGGFAFKN